MLGMKKMELESKKFLLKDYGNKEKMEEEVKIYMDNMRSYYPNAIITKEFYKGPNILVRVTKNNIIQNNKIISLEKDELEREEVRIKEKGINGLGENVNGEQIEHQKGGNERERGER